MLRIVRRVALVCLLSLVCASAHAAGVGGPYPTATLTVSDAANSGGGSITVQFNGFTETVPYGPASSGASLASALAGMLTRDFHAAGLYAKADANTTDPNVVTLQLVNGSRFTALATVNASPFGVTGAGFGALGSGTPDQGIVTLTLTDTNTGAVELVSSTPYGEGSTSQGLAADLAVSACADPATRSTCKNLVTVTAETASPLSGGSGPTPGAHLYLKAGPGVGADPYIYSLTFTSSSNAPSPFSASNASGSLSSGSTTTTIAPVYGYLVANGSGGSGYDAAGNLVGVMDTVMGTWSYSYDPLNRLVTGAATGWGPYGGQYLCWSYDGFGNRLSQSVSTTPCSQSPPPSFAAHYTSANRMQAVLSNPARTIAYDAAGDVINDGTTQYTYDAAGRVCALYGPEGRIGYQYDANGTRIGKGSVTNWQSCDITTNGYQPSTDFVLDLGQSQMTEVALSGGSSAWTHTNVMADGMLVATYDRTGAGLHFYLNDALGSRRAQTDPGGVPEQTCQSLPFGDQLYCTGSLNSPTEHHFTGKERDTESGLDYFGARYYAASFGRFMSPDWSAQEEPVPYAKLDDPQSLNLYAYVRNNPLGLLDPDGHGWWGDFFQGVADSTYRPFVQIVEHPIATAQGLGNAVIHPIATAEGIGTAIKDTVVAAAHGDGRAIGQIVGTGISAVATAGAVGAVGKALSAGAVVGADTGAFLGEATTVTTEETYAVRLAEAQEAYPGKAGTIENHHIAPKYLGGAPNGPTVPLDGAYHQMITNEFRNLAPYGTGPVSPEQLQNLMNSVYDKFPLPPGSN